MVGAAMGPRLRSIASGFGCALREIEKVNVRTLEDVERSVPSMSVAAVAWARNCALPRDCREEVKDLPCKVRPYVRAMVRFGEDRLGELSKKLGVSRSRLYDLRMRVCEYLGHDSELVKVLYPKFSAQISIDHEPRCNKCMLRGHTSEACDLPGIDYYASRRYG